MTQEVLVELDLHGNKIQRVAAGVDLTDAVNVGQLGDYISVPSEPPPPPGSVIVWDPAAGTPPGSGGWVPVDPTSPTYPAVPPTREIAVGPGLGGGGPLDDDVSIWVDYGNAIIPSPDGITVLTGTGIMFEPASVNDQALAVDKSVLDGWYPSIPPTDPTTPPGTTIVWDGDSWELVLPGTLPPPSPAGTLIGAATVVVVPGVVVTGGTANVVHNLGNNNVIAVVQNAAGCQVGSSVCSGATANELTIGAEDGTYTVIVTGIKTA